MEKHLKLFNTILQYNEFKNNIEKYILPNVVVCEEELDELIFYNDFISIKNAYITTDQLTYNGEQQYATNIIVSLNGDILRNNIDYIVSEDNGGINVGNYIFTLRGIGNYKDEKNGIFTINKVTPTVVAPTAKTLTYNGSNQQLINAGSTNFGTLKYSLDNLTWSTDIPVGMNVGSYTVYYKVEGNSNINDIASTLIECSINVKQPNITIELSQDTYTYNGNTKEPIVTIKDGSTIIPSEEYTVSYSNNINAGTATITISDNTGGNYIVNGSTTFTINKVTPTVVAPTAKTLAYNGYSQQLVNAGSTNFGTLKYSLDNSNWSTDIPVGMNAGSYTVYYKVDGDNNINNVESASIECLINKVTPVIIAPTNANPAYNGSNQRLANAGSTNFGTLKYSLDNSNWSTDIPVGTNVGSYTVYYKVEGDSNINDIESTYITCTIEPSIITTYNATSTSSPTQILYSYSNIASIRIDGVKQQNVIASYTFDTLGEHTVLFTFKPDYSSEISSYAFSDCSSLTSITIPDSVTSIGYSAFYNCSGLTSITIPNSVTSISDGAFMNCSGLTSITVDNNNATYDSRNNCNAIIETSTNKLITGCKNTVIPNSVTSIGNSAFYGCSGLTSITIPDLVTSIGNSAFYGCSGLTSITIPDLVTSISNYTFCGCSGLTSITIPDLVTSIDQSAFNCCYALTSVTIPDSVTSIGQSAFQDCYGLTSITCNATSAPTIQSNTFMHVHSSGILTVPAGSTGYNVWMSTASYYLGKYNWTKVEQ